MTPQELIRKKRDGARFTPAEIEAFITGVCDGSWADYQTSALVMAMFVQGLNQSEQTALVRAMLESGERLDFSDLDAPVADKHSTGGVGDKTSLVIAPIVAACGLAVPMISGRGLGHTGGTLDKLEAIEGFKVNLSTRQLRRIIKRCGFAMAGQTKRLVPADRKLYALRDATATVESVPLIVASIMSKKLAEGLDALVLDVKTGSGAFMEDLWDARELAKGLVKTGRDFKVKTQALITDMSQPLGEYVGNALEVYECLRILRGETTDAMRPTLELSIELAARMLVLTRTAADADAARALCRAKLDSGAALELFRQNVELQKGDARVCDEPERLVDKQLKQIAVTAARDGFVESVATKNVGALVSAIGGGRVKKEDKIDHAVGFAVAVKIGDAVKKGDALGTIFCRTDAQAASIRESLTGAFRIGDAAPARPPLVVEAVG